MTFREQLCDHIGSLVRLKTELYWYDTYSYDGFEGRVCLLLKVRPTDLAPDLIAEAKTKSIWSTFDDKHNGMIIQILVNEGSRWVWICEDDMELVK